MNKFMSQPITKTSKFPQTYSNNSPSSTQPIPETCLLSSLTKHTCSGNIETKCINIEYNDFNKTLSLSITACSSVFPQFESMVNKYFKDANKSIAELKTGIQTLDKNSGQYQKYAAYIKILERKSQSIQYKVLDMIALD